MVPSSAPAEPGTRGAAGPKPTPIWHPGRLFRRLVRRGPIEATPTDESNRGPKPRPQAPIAGDRRTIQATKAPRLMGRLAGLVSVVALAPPRCGPCRICAWDRFLREQTVRRFWESPSRRGSIIVASVRDRRDAFRRPAIGRRHPVTDRTFRHHPGGRPAHRRRRSSHRVAGRLRERTASIDGPSPGIAGTDRARRMTLRAPGMTAVRLDRRSELDRWRDLQRLRLSINPRPSRPGPRAAPGRPSKPRSLLRLLT